MSGHDPFESKWWIDRLVAITASHKRTKALIRGAQIHATYMEHEDARQNVSAQLTKLESWVYDRYSGIPKWESPYVDQASGDGVAPRRKRDEEAQ